ncbi:hypothetical protein [Streptomyces triticiradicis]|uniref:Uncharacterized protein n=1 Tax=Streptomyces triticiradicis TaxID=2651189 RepID=A0A7J5DM35_9ACTN|nr:hypothetical protein [Streptomyces triticiradicis]KAB1989774.1 hypothetical protein F8144_05335 [Streptomyces triticiradicis]
MIIDNIGTGKARSAWAALSSLLYAEKSAHGFRETLARPDALTRPAVSSTVLLSASEADNKLPSITSPLILRDEDSLARHSGHDPVGLLEALCLFLKEIEGRIQQLREVLEVLLDVCHFEAADPPPVLATAPCGVIRFAAPMVPRAPGGGQPMSLAADYYALTA